MAEKLMDSSVCVYDSSNHATTLISPVNEMDQSKNPKIVSLLARLVVKLLYNRIGAQSCLGWFGMISEEPGLGVGFGYNIAYNR